MPTKTEYKNYLETERWAQLRRKVIEERPRCERCFVPRWLASIVYDQDLNAHHKSYANQGTDNEEHDLEPLCRRCHDLETFGRSELRAVKSAVCTSCRIVHFNPYSDSCETCTRLGESVEGRRFLVEQRAALHWDREGRGPSRKEQTCAAQDEAIAQISNEATRVLLSGMCGACDSIEFKYTVACVTTNWKLFEDKPELTRLFAFLKDRDPSMKLALVKDAAISLILTRRRQEGESTRPEVDAAIGSFKYSHLRSKQTSIRLALGAAEKRGDMAELRRLMDEKLKIDREMSEAATA